MSTDEQILRLARAVVETTAPEEMNSFEPTSRAFFRNRKKARRSRGDTALSFGPGEIVTLVTPAALIVATAVVQSLAERAGPAIVERGLRMATWLRGKMGGGGAASTADITPLTLDENALARIRRVAEEKARALGLPESRVQLLVDALMGALARSDDEVKES